MRNKLTIAFLALLALGLLIILGPIDQEPEQVAKDSACTWVKQQDGSEVCR